MYMNSIRRRNCNCGYNTMQDMAEDNDSAYDNNMYQNACKNVANYTEMQDSCLCGFDEENNFFPENPMYAQSYVPFQTLNKTFIPSVGLKMGTIFPELVSPYMPGQSQQEIEYIKNTNTIKEGCNS